MTGPRISPIAQALGTGLPDRHHPVALSPGTRAETPSFTALDGMDSTLPNPDHSPPTSEPRWYCLKSKPKAEHLAAKHLQRLEEIEVFCPRVRYEKATRRGKVWFVEALFPGYLFARFDLENRLRQVQAAPNVSNVVHFGDLYLPLSDDLIAQLRAEYDDEEAPATLTEPIQAGDEVTFADGAFKGLTVLVTRIMSGKDRIRILLEWLGKEHEAEVETTSVIKAPSRR